MAILGEEGPPTAVPWVYPDVSQSTHTLHDRLSILQGSLQQALMPPIYWPPALHDHEVKVEG